MRNHTVLVFVTSLVLTSAIGCGSSGPPTGKVSGTVTIDGQPASGVTVYFNPVVGGRASQGETDSSGYYELIFSPTAKGALIGSHKVKISGPGPSDQPPTGGQMLTDDSAAAKYENVEKTVEVAAGSNTIDLTYP